MCSALDLQNMCSKCQIFFCNKKCIEKYKLYKRTKVMNVQCHRHHPLMTSSPLGQFLTLIPLVIMSSVELTPSLLPCHVFVLKSNIYLWTSRGHKTKAGRQSCIRNFDIKKKSGHNIAASACNILVILTS